MHKAELAKMAVEDYRLPTASVLAPALRIISSSLHEFAAVGMDVLFHSVIRRFAISCIAMILDELRHVISSLIS